MRKTRNGMNYFEFFVPECALRRLFCPLSLALSPVRGERMFRPKTDINR
jgi:hypothetical protein